MFKKLLREPLIHFLVLGALLLFVSNVVTKRTSGDTRKIFITAGQIEHLQNTFARAHQRSPNLDELRGLIRDYLREEVYYREALSLGLDRDDAPIRQRLRTKMEFISEDIAVQAQPTDDQLQEYLNAHPEKFRIDEHLTFEQVYLDPSRHGEHLKADAQQLLAKLNKVGAKADLSAIGDPFLLGGETENVSLREVARDYGDKFANTMAGLPLGKWQGAIESGLGMHLVFVSVRSEGRRPQLSEVRGAVRYEWANDYRIEANEQFYQNLLKHYTVAIDLPQDAAESKAGAGRP